MISRASHSFLYGRYLKNCVRINEWKPAFQISKLIAKEEVSKKVWSISLNFINYKLFKKEKAK